MMDYKFMDAQLGGEAKNLKVKFLACQEVCIRECVPLDKLKITLFKFSFSPKLRIHKFVDHHTL